MIWIIDAEADSLNATKIHCLSVSSPDGSIKKTTTDYDEMRRFFNNAKIIVGHNIARFDVPMFERLLGIKYKGKIVDTLALSWVLYPKRNRHGLEYWGIDYGVPKPYIDDWENQTIEEYIHRCQEDVEINRRLWKDIWSYLVKLYGKSEKIWEYLDYISFKMYCAKLQEDSGWHVDIPFATKNLSDMVTEKEEKVAELFAAMPKLKIYKTRTRPKKFFNKKGDLTKLGEEWVNLLNEMKLPADTEEVKILDRLEDPNPSSFIQIKDWLFSLGWKPETFKYVGDRKIPQINLENGKGICPSIKKLFEKEPRLEVLEGLSILGHRIPSLKGILGSIDTEGRTKARIQGITNTLRFQHSTVVNLPRVNRAYSEGIRGSLIAPPGKILCGSDMSSLEDRIKQHFIFEYDPEYVHSMNREDFDPHLTVAGLAGMLTADQIRTYKENEKALKPIRDIAKNGNYACQYGAGIARLMITCSIDRAAAARLHAAYWELNWAVKKVASVQVVKTVNDQMWLKNPINGFYYSLREMKDVFSTLVQGTASYVFDMWVQNILEVRPQLTAQFHDEIVLCITEGSEDKASALIDASIQKLNQRLNLNRELGVGTQFSKRYSEIH